MFNIREIIKDVRKLGQSKWNGKYLVLLSFISGQIIGFSRANDKSSSSDAVFRMAAYAMIKITLSRMFTHTHMDMNYIKKRF